MEYEDTNILRTQYVDDVVSQRQDLEKVMNYQDAGIQEGAGFSSMVPLVDTLTGKVPGVPFINFYNCKITELNPETLNFNAIPADKLNKVFRGHIKFGAYSNNVIDLSNIVNFKYVTDFSYMFAGNVAYETAYTSIKLGKHFDLTNATSLKHLFGWTPYSSPRNSRYVYLYGIEDVPIAHCNNLTDVTYLCAGLTLEASLNEGLKLLLKIYGAKPTSLEGFFAASYAYYTGASCDSELLDSALTHIYRNWDLSNITNLSRLCYGRPSGTLSEGVFKLLQKLNLSNVTDISNIFYEGNQTYPSGFTPSLLDLSMKSFDSLENANYSFYYAMLSEIHLGPALNKTIINLSQCFCQGSKSVLKVINVAFWDLSNTIDVYGAFTSCKALEELYFGLNLGAAFTSTSSNNSNYTVNLSNSNLLSVSSVLHLLNGVYDLKKRYLEELGKSTVATQRIMLHADVKAKLTPEEIAIATNKGWTVS